jgi:hypothetical protein
MIRPLAAAVIAAALIVPPLGARAQETEISPECEAAAWRVFEFVEKEAAAAGKSLSADAETPEGQKRIVQRTAAKMEAKGSDNCVLILGFPDSTMRAFAKSVGSGGLQ